jgi:hypothetical protein
VQSFAWNVRDLAKKVGAEPKLQVEIDKSVNKIEVAVGNLSKLLLIEIAVSPEIGFLSRIVLAAQPLRDQALNLSLPDHGDRYV